jgi:SET domain-containing protein
MTSSRFTGVSAKMDQDVLRAYKASGINERMLQAPHLRNNEAAQLNSLYKEMKKEWKENIYLARSKIQGLGLYAKKDLDMNQPIIEYIGEMIRNEVSHFCKLQI